MGWGYIGFALLGAMLAGASRLWTQYAQPGRYLPQAAFTFDSAVLLVCWSTIALVFRLLCQKRILRLTPDMHRDISPLILLVLVTGAIGLVYWHLLAAARALSAGQFDERAYRDFGHALQQWSIYVAYGITVTYCAVLGMRYRRGAPTSVNGPSGKAE